MLTRHCLLHGGDPIVVWEELRNKPPVPKRYRKIELDPLEIMARQLERHLPVGYSISRPVVYGDLLEAFRYLAFGMKTYSNIYNTKEP